MLTALPAGIRAAKRVIAGERWASEPAAYGSTASKA
jgi:hypothetical protein